MTQRELKALLEQAFNLGFAASRENWNGWYPFYNCPERLPRYPYVSREREKAMKEILEQQNI